MDQGMSTLKVIMSEEEYWKNIDEGKTYRLFGDN